MARKHIGSQESLTRVKDQNIRPHQNIIKIFVVAVLQREERNMLNSIMLFQLQICQGNLGFFHFLKFFFLETNVVDAPQWRQMVVYRSSLCGS